jgi:acyl-CoA oxidase
MSREEKFDFFWRRIQLLMKYKPEIFTENDPKYWYGWCLIFAEAATPIYQHQMMFVMCIEFLASPEQKAKWYQPARNLNIIGSYSQTELGHGSNVADIETTATLDMKTDEWVIHTPHVRATKFWPGNLAFGTHTVVFARLIVEENDYGVWPIMVQVRSLEDHKPMPGITVGDVGTKLGFNSVDNGWVSFDQVRVPRTDLLSRIVEVEKDGTFSMKGDRRHLYSIMLHTR